MKKSFIIHIDSLGILDELTDEQAGQLFKLIHQFHNPNKPKQTEITQVVNLAFYSFKSQFLRDIHAYENICERNKVNGMNGGRPKNKNPRKPKKADSDSDSDSDSKKDNKINIEFNVFWNLYDKKVGSKDKCITKWNNLSNEDRQRIIDTLPNFKSQIKDKQYQPYPETYLNGKRWNDEITEQKPKERDHYDLSTWDAYDVYIGHQNRIQDDNPHTVIEKLTRDEFYAKYPEKRK